ncbi:MAG TPA: response regulator [Candidatus Sulfotelmatobacter sp.]
MQADSISTGPRALIVEDEALIAEELRERLLRLGFAVIAAVSSGEEGIEIATRERPDLVLMDIRLSGDKDGVQAAREIREQVDVPIVYLTAYSDRRTVERANKTDHDGFILKPFLRRELHSTIEVALKRHAIRAKRKLQ